MKKIKPEVFLPPFFLFFVCIIINIADSDLFTEIVNTVNGFVVHEFGWLLILQIGRASCRERVSDVV